MPITRKMISKWTNLRLENIFLSRWIDLDFQRHGRVTFYDIIKMYLLQLESRVVFNLGLVFALVLVSWFFGYYGLSIAWTIILVSLLIVVWKSTFFSLVQQAVLLEEDRIHRKKALENLETCEWLNLFINRWWLTSAETIYQITKEALDPVFNDAKPPFLESIELRHFYVGENTPTIRSIRTYNMSESSMFKKTDKLISNQEAESRTFHRIAMEIDLVLNSDDFRMIFKARIGGKGLGFDLDVSIEKLNFRGRAFVIVELDSKLQFPHIPKISITFIKKPDVWFNIRVLKSVQMMEVPVLKSWIHSVVMSTLTAALVDPGKMDIHLFPEDNELSPDTTASNLKAIGVLTIGIQVHQASKPPIWTPLSEDTRWCVVRLGDQKHVSTYLSLSDDWQDTSSFIVYSMNDDFIHLKIKSKRLVNQVTLAEHKISLAKYDLENERCAEIQLAKKNQLASNLNMKSPLPVLSMKLKYTPLANPLDRINDEVDGKISNPNEGLIDNGKTQSGIIYVCIHSADLNNAERGGKESLNSYCLILHDKTKIKSTHCLNSLTPDWESNVEFLTTDCTKTSITFVICNWNEDGLNNDSNIIGFCSISNNQKLALIKEKLSLIQYADSEDVVGTIKVTITFRAVPSVFKSELSEVVNNVSGSNFLRRTRSKKKKKILLGSRDEYNNRDIMNLFTQGSGVMEFSILCACDLVAKDLNGFSDPYCEIKIDEEVVFKTIIKKKTLFPEWNELITIRLPNENELLKIVVWDWDAIGRSDFIGELILTLKDIRQHSTHESPEWFKLQNTKSGSIRLQMRIIFESDSMKNEKEITSGQLSNSVSMEENEDFNFKDANYEKNPSITVSKKDEENKPENKTSSSLRLEKSSSEYEISASSSKNNLYTCKADKLPSSQSVDIPLRIKNYKKIQGTIINLLNLSGTSKMEKYYCKIKLIRSKNTSSSSITIAKSSPFTMIDNCCSEVHHNFQIDAAQKVELNSVLAIQVFSAKKKLISSVETCFLELLNDSMERQNVEKSLNMVPQGIVTIKISHGKEISKTMLSMPRLFRSWSLHKIGKS